MKNGKKLYLLLFLLSLCLGTGCEVGRQIQDTDSYPLLGNLNLTNDHIVQQTLELRSTAYHASTIQAVTLSFLNLSNGFATNISLTVNPGRMVSFQFWYSLPGYGSWEISFTARNGLGAESTSSPLRVHYYNQSGADETPPLLLVSTPTNGQVTGASYLLSGSVSDNQSGLQGLYWSLDGQPFLLLTVLNGQFSTNISSALAGWHTNRLYAVDGAGNHTLTNSLRVFYQAGTPWVTVTSPQNGSFVSRTQQLYRGLSGVDSAQLTGLWLRLNSGSYNPLTLQTNWSNQLTLQPGTNTVSLQVSADNGLTSYSALHTLYVDTQLPVLSVLTPTNNSILYSSGFSLQGSASDSFSGLAGVYIAVDDQNFNAFTSQNSWSLPLNLDNGSHTLYLFAKDRAGNYSPTNRLDITITNQAVTSNSMTIWYYNHQNWSQPRIYAWSGSWEPAGSWSGTAMSNAGGGWYAHTFSTNMLLNVIFSDNGNYQTGNLSHNGTGWYKLGVWYSHNPDWLPRTWAMPGGGYFTNSTVQVSLYSAGKDLLQARYTLDGSVPGPGTGILFNSNTQFSLGGGMNLGDQATLRLWVTNLWGEQRQSYTFTKTNALPRTAFNWKNATIYFVFIDRFYDGSSANNTAYGREHDAAHTSPGLMHGGDLAGLTQKLQQGYFTNLGIDVLWITCPMEQMHGWVEGGNGAFKHYGYHGYYPIDWTRMDASFGTPGEFQTFVDTAHSQGIRVLMDIIINHTGYAPIEDLHEYNIDVLNWGWENAKPGEFHQYINYSSPNWVNWWGPQWIRAGLPGYDQPGTDNYTGSFSGLTDLKTESTTPPSSLPVFYNYKPDTAAVYHADWTVSDYLINWISDWVRTYGIDGFRCDTAKHVRIETWLDLKTNAVAALREWKQNNPGKKLDDLDLWMTGEHWNWGSGGLSKTWDDPEHPGDYTTYITSGAFDSMINFDPQKFLADKLYQSYNSMDSLYTTYANLIHNDPDFNTVSYLSSHDTILWYQGGNNRTVNTGGSQSSTNLHIKTANYFFFFPGAIQLFYGDELGRLGISSGFGSDQDQVTRSFMPWVQENNILHRHWQKLGRFRQRHIAIGAGQHTRLQDSPYVFKRSFDPGGPDEDVVVIALGVSGSTTLNVSSTFAENTLIRDYYTGQTTTVSGGQVTFNPGSDVLLLEIVK